MIRCAEIDDIPFIIRKGNEIFNDRSPGYYKIQPHLVCKYIEDEPDGQFILEIDKKIIGFILTGTDWRKKYKESLWLFWIWIDPEYRNKNMASRILEEIMIYARSKGYHQILTDVDETNIAAINILKNFEFNIDAKTLYFKKELDNL